MPRPEEPTWHPARLIRVYSEQAADHWLFEEQLRRWGAGPLSPEQCQERWNA